MAALCWGATKAGYSLLAGAAFAPAISRGAVYARLVGTHDPTAAVHVAAADHGFASDSSKTNPVFVNANESSMGHADLAEEVEGFPGAEIE